MIYPEPNPHHRVPRHSPRSCAGRYTQVQLTVRSKVNIMTVLGIYNLVAGLNSLISFHLNWITWKTEIGSASAWYIWEFLAPSPLTFDPYKNVSSGTGTTAISGAVTICKIRNPRFQWRLHTIRAEVEVHNPVNGGRKGSSRKVDLTTSTDWLRLRRVD